MTDIVVTVPFRKLLDLYTKFDRPHMAFWSMGGKPKNISCHDWIWFVCAGRLRGGLEIREIENGPLDPLSDVDGYNPSVPSGGCRLQFYDSIGSKVLTLIGDKDFPSLRIKGFQGFRYKWWKFDWETEDLAVVPKGR